MSNHLAQIYSTTKNAEKYIVLNSQNVELSGNVKLTNGNLEVSNNLIFNTFSVGDKITFKETNNTTAYNILHDNLKLNNDASFNNVDISGNLNIKTGVDITGQITLNANSGISGEVLTSQGASAPIWAVPSGGVDAISFYLSTTQNNLTDSTTYQILSFGSYTRGSLSGVSFNTTTNRLDITNAGTYLVSGVAFLKGQSGAIYHTNQSFIQIYNSATPPAVVSSFEGGLAVGSSDPDITGQGAVISSFVYEFNANDSVAFSARALGANFRLLANLSYITFLRIK